MLDSLFDPSELQILCDEFDNVVSSWAERYYEQGRLSKRFEDDPFEHRLFSIHQAIEGNCHEFLSAVSGKRKTAGMFYVMTLHEIFDVVESIVGSENLVHPQINVRAKLPDGKTVVSWHQDHGHLHKNAEDTIMVKI